MKIIQASEIIHHCEYRKFFKRTDGGGYSFQCDKEGNVFTDKLFRVALENYDKCCKDVAGPTPQFQVEIVTHEWDYRQDAIGECVCGHEVDLRGFTNTCDGCERDYNRSGQLLASRSQWGEETGESLSDILSIP